MVDRCTPVVGLYKSSLYTLCGKAWLDDNVEIKNLTYLTYIKISTYF